MSANPVSIRPARPVLDEGRVFARFANEITEGGFRVMLGPRFEEILAHAFVQPGHGMSYERTWFAKRGGRIVGMVCGYIEGDEHRSEDEALMVAPGNRLRRSMGVVFMRWRWRMIGHPFPGEFYVEFLIVESTLRGQRIGDALMVAMEAEARRAGADRLTLDVAVKNTGGRRFYERRGMIRVPEWPKGRLGRRVVLRMTKRVG
jgi:ribosomal protein S18 acetylase RimI-like enzyme